MEKLTELEAAKNRLLRRIQALGDMRAGTLSVRYQRCGKTPCVCKDPKHPGHGPIFSFSTVADGKTRIRNYKLGPELDNLSREVENYRAFKALSQELIAVSSRICDLRPVPEIKDNAELEGLKKNLKRLFMKKYRKKSTG